MRTTCGVAIGFPASASTSAFQPGPAAFLRPPSTAGLPRRFHPPASLTPPPEYYGLRPAARVSKSLATFQSTGQRLPWGSVPLRGINQRRPHDPPGSPPGSSFRPRRFSRPRRFAPPPTLRVCFAPLPRPGFALQGIVPLCGAVPGFPGRVMPSWRWTHPPATSECAPAFRALLPASSAVSPGTD